MKILKKLLNTLYITSPERYLSLDGENVVVLEKGMEIGRLPLHNLQAIISMGYNGASPALMEACASHNIVLSFISPSGRFLASVCGPVHGNVVLRKQQYRISDDMNLSTMVAKNFILGKLYNSRWVIERAIRDYPLRLDIQKLKVKSKSLYNSIEQMRQADSNKSIMGIEGEAATVYFSVFDDLILQQKESFYWHTRSKRPPLDNVNAMLSFAYTMLAGMCSSALELVGLDPYVGFLHRDRPGRVSLALDLMEELRSVFADRFVLSLINKRMVKASDFVKKENGAVLLTDDARKKFLSSWQDKKQETIIHPYLNEKVEWGMVPYVQALLLSRFIRGDLDEYPPFFWK